MIDIRDAPDAYRQQVLHTLSTEVDIIRRAYAGLGITNALVAQIKERCEYWRMCCRRDNVYMPGFRLLIFPSINQIELVREDLDRTAIRILVVNMVTKYAMLDMMELANAIRYAFPNYKPEVD